MLGRSLVALLLCSIVAPSWAADDTFFQGKQITVIVTAEGNSAYVSYARLLAQFMPDHLPGKPSMIVQAMPGGSGLTGAGFVYNVAPKDGTVIGAVNANIPTAPLLERDAAKFDVNKYNWLGNISHDPFVGFVWHTSPAQSLEQARTTELIAGGQAVGSASVDMAIMAKEVLGLNVRVVSGYKTSSETKLALEKGEIHGILGNLWTSLKSEKPDWLKEKLVTIVTQFGFSRHPELPDVPLFLDMAKTPQDRKLIELLVAKQEFAKPYVLPPDMPAERVALMRKAFDETMKDPKFLEAAAKQSLPIDRPSTGQELAATTAELSKTPAEDIKRLEAIFAKFRAGKS
jgi:tripartite-type tricarboxylate transporter receptor subunit TctC